MSKQILVVAAHPDDEVLGCAGTIARHVSDGDKVYVVFMSDGVTSRTGVESNEVEVRKQAAKDASNILGMVQSPRFLGFPDNRMDTVALLDIVQTLEQVINEIEPEVVYTHHSGDLNIDHKITHQAVMTACRPQPGFCVREIYSFEVLSSTEWSTNNPFIPNYFVDISDILELKISAIKAYNSELRLFPHARSIESIEALVKYRGASVGVHAAEAFRLERKIVNIND
ncbi:MAG: PIG-L family deacetylase [Candidatus Scalindua sp.]|nr:PIG-L family deacetylase [Candidatus Scalindua sp.]